MFKAMRDLRKIERGVRPQGAPDPLITIFVGLYNAESYLDSLEKFLAAQSGKYRILIVDNNSEDSTWELIHRWPSAANETTTLVQNPLNLGATGSLYLNLDLIETAWVSTIHQDDLYLDEHVDVQSEGIKKAPAACNCVVTDMGSLGSDGRLEPGRPRASWALPDLSAETMFLANLKLHTVPFPAAAFRVNKLQEKMVPWHSTAMPDTEWVLSTLATNAVHYIPRITMHYRENPLSESHALDSSESQLGSFMSLNRVLSSASFYELLANVPRNDRAKFAQAVYKGLKLRIKDSDLLELISLVAAEQISLAWGYSEPESLVAIRQAYSKGGSRRIEGLIDSLLGFYNLRSGLSQFEDRARAHMAMPDGDQPKKKSNKLLGFAIRLLNVLPYWIRRTLFRLIVRSSSNLKKDSAWNFDWR